MGLTNISPNELLMGSVYLQLQRKGWSGGGGGGGLSEAEKTRKGEVKVFKCKNYLHVR